MKKLLLLLLLCANVVAQSVVSTTVPVNTNMVLLGKGTNFFNVNSNLFAITARNYIDLPNMAALRALPVTSLANGAGVNVLGYYSPGDGGGGTYVLTNTVSGTNALGGRIVAAGGSKSWQLQGTRISNLQFGVFPATNNTSIGQELTVWNDYCSANGLVSVLTKGDYWFLNSNALFLRSNTFLDAEPNANIVRAYADPTNSSGGTFQNPRWSPVRVEGTGIPFGGSVPIVVTNIFIRNLGAWTYLAEAGGDLNTDTGTNVGNNIAVIGCSGLRLENLNLGLHTESWALIIASDNVQISGIRIRNDGKRFRDGIHVIGGTNGVISNFDIQAGDDCIAYGSFGAHIGRWTAVGGAVTSTIGNVVDFLHEYGSNTNQLDTFVVSDIVYRTGVFRNTALAAFNKSTNLTYGFKDISISNIRGITGETNQIPGFGIENGIHMTGVENLTISDFHIGLALRRNLYFGTNKNVALINCTARGTLLTNLQETIYVENCDRFLISGGSYYTNPTNTGATTARFNNVGSVIINNAFFENLNGSQVLVSGTGSGNFQIANSIINSTGTAFAFLVNPTNVIISGNTLTTATTPATWAGGTPPASAQIVGNIGLQSIGTTKATEFQVVTTGGTYVSSIDSPGNIQMRLANTNSQFYFASDNGVTNNILLRIGFQPKDPTKNRQMLFTANDGGTFPWVGWGGGSATMDGPSWHAFYASPIASPYTAGTERARINEAGLRVEPAGVSGFAAASAALDVVSTTKGFLAPRMDSTQRDAISSPAEGLQIFNTTTSKLQVRAGGAWVDLH